MLRFPSQRLQLSLVFCVGLLFTFPLHAQKITGDVSGEVSDATGAMLPYVTI